MSFKNFPFRERRAFENLLEMAGGHVLDLSRAKFAEFFREHNINIDSEKYAINGDSKAKRLRAFWELEGNNKVLGEVLKGLLEEYRDSASDEMFRKNKKTYNSCIATINRLLGTQIAETEDISSNEEEVFLKKKFKKSIDGLDVDDALREVLTTRIREIEEALKNNMPLSGIFLIGSCMEAILLDCISKESLRAKKSDKVPKNKKGNIASWSLSDLIDVAYDISIIDLDIQKHSNAVRGFRNYIHPRQQIAEGFTPDKHTLEIAEKVLYALVDRLSEKK